MALQGLSPIRFESVSAVTATNSVELGTRVTDGGVDYVYCYNAGAATIGQGKMGRLSPSSLSSGYSVVVSNPASQSGGHFVVGVAHNAAIAASSYGWLATRGVVLAALDGSEVSMNSGDIVVPGVDGGFVVAAATLSTGLHLGVALNSLVTTVGTGKILFKSPLFS
jgi:hypothetical protein